MRYHPKNLSVQTRTTKGFSLIELVVVLAVISVLLAIALPSFMQAYRSYQLDDGARQVSGILKSTRLEAIRQSKQINCIIQQTTAPVATNIWTDSNGDGAEQATEPQILLAGNVTLMSAVSAPNTGTLATGVGVSSLTAVSPTNSTISFDFRGAVSPVGVYGIYMNYPAVPNVGYRAVILLPSGSTQVWTADSSGNWQQLN